MPPFRSPPISCDRGWEWHLSSFGMIGNPLISRCLLALCWFISAGGVTLFAAEREVPGLYQGHAPAADAAKRVFTLNLAPDGGATLTTLYIGKHTTRASRAIGRKTAARWCLRLNRWATISLPGP